MRALRTLALELVTFAALAWYAAAHWTSGLIAHDPDTRVLACVPYREKPVGLKVSSASRAEPSATTKRPTPPSVAQSLSCVRPRNDPAPISVVQTERSSRSAGELKSSEKVWAQAADGTMSHAKSKHVTIVDDIWPPAANPSLPNLLVDLEPARNPQRPRILAGGHSLQSRWRL